MKKWLGAVCIVVILAILVIVYTVHKNKEDDARDNNQSQQTLQKVTVSQAYSVFLYAPLYVAEDQGFFKQQGLDVDIITAGGDDKAFASLLSGDAQFAIGDPTFTAVSGEKGQPGTVIASVLSGVPFWGVAKTSVPAITSPAGLKGYNVAAYPAPSTAFALQTKMFLTAGLKPDITQIAPGGLLPALDASKVNIALELEPNVSTAVQNGDHVVYSLSTYYPNFALTGVTVLPDYLQKNPQTAQEFVNALREADNFIRANPSAAASLLNKRFPDTSLSIAQSALQNILSANVIPQTMTVNPTGWQSAIQLRLDVGDIKNSAPYQTYVNTTFSQQADSIK